MWRAIVRRAQPLSWFVAGTLALSYLSAVFFRTAELLYGGRLPAWSVFDVSVFDAAGVATLLLVVACLLVEARVLGWPDSSLRRLLESPSASARTDLFYFFLMCAGLTPVIGWLCSLGLGYFVNLRIRDTLSFQLLRDSSFVLQAGALLVLNPLIFYLHHRLFHTRWLWPFHEIHHSADTLNLITNFRNHPLDVTVRSIFYALPAAVCGIHPFVIAGYSAVAGVVTCFQHSNLDWRLPWLERYVLIGSAGHRVHHGRADRYVDKNFGLLVIWDRIFGTYEPPPSAPFSIGVEDARQLHNSGHAVRDLVRITIRAFRRS